MKNASPQDPSGRERQVGRLRRAGRTLAAVCLVLATVLPLAALAALLGMPPEELAQRAGLTWSGALPPLAPWQRVAAVLVGLAPVGLLARGLVGARRGLVSVARGELFSAQAVAGLRGFAGWASAAALAGLVAPAVASVLLSYGFGPGQRQLALGVSSSALLQLLTSGLVWLIAGLLAEARALADENAQFV
jgi:hypothetical protein